MKTGKKIAFGAALSLGMVVSATGALGGPLPAPELVGVDANEIFVPSGFDSNDDAQIVLHGEYMNTCYKSALPEVNVDRANHTITVAPKAHLRSSCWCAPVAVPFTQPIDLGILEPGKYKVVELGSKGAPVRETSLSIAQSNSDSMDNFMYAPVKTVQVAEGQGGRELVLNGNFTSECMELQEIKTVRDAEHVIEVLPITSYKTGTTCDNSKRRPFEARVKLPTTEPGNYLVHVRLLNGQAINVVETF